MESFGLVDTCFSRNCEGQASLANQIFPASMSTAMPTTTFLGQSSGLLVQLSNSRAIRYVRRVGACKIAGFSAIVRVRECGVAGRVYTFLDLCAVGSATIASD